MSSRGTLRALAVILLAAIPSACIAEDTPMVLPLDPVPLVISTPKGDVSFRIEVADNVVERSRGLMHRDKLPDGQGMLFVFQEEGPQAFWMKDTPQPLDIIFIESDGDIESIRLAKPMDETSLPSVGEVGFVLEIASGEAARLGIFPGAKAKHPLVDAAKPNP